MAKKLTAFKLKNQTTLKIEKLNIENPVTNNTLNPREIANNTKPSDFTHGTDLPCDSEIASPFQAQPIKSNPNPELFEENTNFSRDVPIKGLETKLRKEGRA
jgi:hypothetical protein